MMVNIKQHSFTANLVALAVMLLVFIGLYLIKPVYAFNPGGIALPMRQHLPGPTEQSVVAYDAYPFNATPLAYINVEGHTLNPTDQQQQDMVAYAKDLAKKSGANGLVIKAFGFEGAGPGTPPPLAKVVLYGVAVKVQ